MAKLGEVFGVSARPILSYVERDEVNARFREALSSDKQIIVYGSSKQGKTALVSKYLPYEKNLLVSLTPKTSVLDIYQTVLSSSGIRITTGTTEKRSTETSIGFSAKVKALIPLFGSGEAGTDASVNAGSGTEQKTQQSCHQGPFRLADGQSGFYFLIPGHKSSVIINILTNN